MNNTTLYQCATELMQEIVEHLLKLAKSTANFTNPPDKIWHNKEDAQLLLGGRRCPIDKIPPIRSRKDEWFARSAFAFSIEHAATGLLYKRLKPVISEMIGSAFSETDNFSKVSPEWIHDHAHLLPIMMHAVGTFSKQELRRLIGTVSDTQISWPASRRLNKMILDLGPDKIAKPEHINERMKATTEGIVRDLVGRILLEEFVASSLCDAGVPFRRESEYDTLRGVVYDFRADYVIPDESNPRAFIEVRKSSSRHASLYAKDKMFSAINWKGKHNNCLGILVFEGSWSNTSLEVMSHVFDYVVPIDKSIEVAKTIRRYLDGDDTVLRWLIEFKISAHTP